MEGADEMHEGGAEDPWEGRAGCWAPIEEDMPGSVMVRPGHTWNRPSSEEDDEEAEDPVDAMILRTGCMAQHRELQECMAARQDWRHCQPQVRAFGECMARQQRAEEPRRVSESHQAHPSPTVD